MYYIYVLYIYMHHFHPFSWITSGNLLAFISLMEFPPETHRLQIFPGDVIHLVRKKTQPDSMKVKADSENRYTVYPLVSIQFAIENGNVIVDLPIENSDFL